MTCATCTNYQPKQSGDMAKVGFARCALGPRWQFRPPWFECVKHELATQEVISARSKWAAKWPRIG